jgi:hypothetical protein
LWIEGTRYFIDDPATIGIDPFVKQKLEQEDESDEEAIYIEQFNTIIYRTQDLPCINDSSRK